MKIVLWCEYFLPVIGGAEIFLSHLIEALTKRNIHCHVITSKNNPSLNAFELWKDVPVTRLDIHEALQGNLKTWIKIRNELFCLYREIQPDLIHIHSTGPSLFLEMQTHDRFRIPRFLTLHSFFSYPPKKDGYLLRYLPKMNFLSGVSRKTLQMGLDLFETKIPPHRVIYNGLPPPSTDTLEPQVQKKSDERDIILFLGRLSKEKGVDLGIRALHSLQKKYPNAQLWIAGNGPEKEALEALVQELKLADRVEFLGPIPPNQIYQYIAQARFLILPSRTDEGIPLIVLEAAHLSKPVIASNRGGIPEVIQHEKTGILIDSEDWLALAKRMESLLAQPNLCTQLGQKAHMFIQEKFNFSTMVDHYEDIYHQLCPSHPNTNLILD